MGSKVGCSGIQDKEEERMKEEEWSGSRERCVCVFVSALVCFFFCFSALGGVSCQLFGVELGSEAEESGVVK
jgi:hypothetical protein